MAGNVIAGVDEAGRGAVIGPMVIAGVSVTQDKEAGLKRMGVRDSKKIAPKRREKLAKAIERIAKDVVVIKVEACKVDSYRKAGVNLNELEKMKMADVLSLLEAGKAYVDSPDVSPERLKEGLEREIGKGTELVVEHGADDSYPVCSAASIVAKVTRDEEVRKLHKKYRDFGSGYPSDERTTKFLEEYLKKHNKFPDCVRKSWATIKTIKKDHKQSKLAGWLRRQD